MKTGLYIYKTDKSRKYIVRIARGIGDNPVFGFTPATGVDFDSLPRGMTMRSIGCAAPIGSNFRRFPVGKPAAEILKTFAQFIYKGVQYTPRRYTPEKSRK